MSYQGGTLGPASCLIHFISQFMHRLLRGNTQPSECMILTSCFFNSFYFKSHVILGGGHSAQLFFSYFILFQNYCLTKGEHSAQLLYDIDNLGFNLYFFCILFQNSCDIEGEHSAQLVNDRDLANCLSQPR